MFPFSGLAANY